MQRNRKSYCLPGCKIAHRKQVRLFGSAVIRHAFSITQHGKRGRIRRREITVQRRSLRHSIDQLHGMRFCPGIQRIGKETVSAVGNLRAVAITHRRPYSGKQGCLHACGQPEQGVLIFKGIGIREAIVIQKRRFRPESQRKIIGIAVQTASSFCGEELPRPHVCCCAAAKNLIPDSGEHVGNRCSASVIIPVSGLRGRKSQGTHPFADLYIGH